MEQKQAFLLLQFRLQRAHYYAHYPGAEFRIIVGPLGAIGRVCTHRSRSEIRLVDIALLPLYRGCGIGGRCLRSLLTEAAAARQAVTAHVARDNPARRLYERLGFRTVEENGPYQLIVWSAAHPGPAD